MGLKKQAAFFTIDALVGAMILIVGILLLTSSYVSDQPRINLNYLSQDITNVLGTLTIGELNSTNSYVNELIIDGNITNLNNTVLEQIGEFWSKDSMALAENLTRNITEGFVPEAYGFGLWISNELIYKRDIPITSIVTSKRIISGMEKAKPINGYVSKARATVVNRNMTKVISISPEGAGWYNGVARISKFFNFSGDYTLGKVTFYVSAHIGNNDDDFIADFNSIGGCTFDMTDMDMIREEDVPGSGRGIYGIINVPTNCINDGMNEITMTLHNGPYNAHFHPGTLLMINYINNNVVVEDLYTEFSKRYYFDDIESYGSGNNGVWAVLPFHIPEGATDVSVAIQVAAMNVNDYNGNICCKWEGSGCVLSCKEADYIIYLNSDTALERDGSPDLNPTYFYSPSNTSPYIQTGTNTLGVYISNFEDRRYGYNNVRIYSDPINYPDNSSYVEVNYTFTPPIVSGVIEVTAAKQFGGNWSTPIETNFSFPLVAEAVSDVFVHYAQIFSAKTRVKADTNSPPSNQVFLSPAVRVTPTSVLIPASTIDASPAATNYLEVEDTFGEPRTISPNSTIEYSFYVNAYVGYGTVFWNQSAADEDAEERLAEILGEYIDINNLVIENITMTNVPSLWGPSLIEVRVWH